MKGVRIAYDAKRAFANRRGLGNYSRDMIRLAQTFAPQNEYVLCGKPSALCEVGSAQIVSPQGVWRCCPALWRSYGCLKQLKNVDLYHGLSGELPFGIHRTGIRTVVTVHDTIFLRYPRLYSPTYRWLFTQKMRYALRHADRIIAISEQTKRDIITFFHADEQKIRVAYQGCNKRFREPVRPEQIETVRSRYHLPEQYVLYVGALEERKNIHTLIKAFARAQITMPLVLVGAMSSYGKALQRQAEEAGVQLYILSDIPQDDLPALYHEAKLFVYPSVFEGFGIPILEALCVGTPVLTSSGSCFAEVGGEAAMYADPAKPEEIASQLKRILSDDALRQQMIQRGHQQAARFTDEKVALQLLSIYKELCAF